MELEIFLSHLDKKVQLLPDQTLEIGREASGLKIPNPLISRKHCIIKLLSNQNLEIYDENSTNGTKVFTTKGELIPIKNKYTFRKLSEINPIKLILADEVEIFFEYINLKTKTKTQEQEKPISLMVNHPKNLSLENIEHISKILPSAGMAMIRKMLELKLKKFLNESREKTLKDLLHLIEQKKALNSEEVALAKHIQTLGNQALHEEVELSEKTVKEKLKKAEKLFKKLESENGK